MTLGSGVKERITRGRLWQVVYKSNIPTTDTTNKAGFARKRSGSQHPIQSTDVFSMTRNQLRVAIECHKGGKVKVVKWC